MLVLKRIQYFNECRTCRLTREPIVYGEYYYEDDEDGMVVKASAYRDLRDKYKEDTFDNSRLEYALSEEDYKQQLILAEQEFLNADLMSRKIHGREMY